MLILDLGSQPILDIYTELGEHLASLSITPDPTDLEKATLAQVKSVEGEEPSLLISVNGGDDQEPTVTSNDQFNLKGIVQGVARFDLGVLVKIRSTGKLSVVFESPTNVQLFRRTPHIVPKLESLRVAAQALQVI